MSFSAGIAHSPTAGADRDAIVMAADKAMYTAKRSGKGRTVVADGRQVRVSLVTAGE